MNYTLNGKTYKVPELTFNVVCDLEDKGISLIDLEKQEKMFNFIREIIALSFNGDSVKAGNEIEAHVINGGSFEEIANILKQAIDNSGFFKALLSSANKQAK